MPTKLVVDCTTNQTIEVELTPEEIAQQEADAIAIAEEVAKFEAEKAAKAAAKAAALAKLTALGLTEEEAKAIAG